MLSQINVSLLVMVVMSLVNDFGIMKIERSSKAEMSYSMRM